MNLQKKLKFQKLNIVPFALLSKNEAEEVRIMRNHPEVQKWMYQSHKITKNEHSLFLKRLRDDSRNAYWVVKDSKNAVLGVIGLHRIDLVNKNAYLGIYTNPFLRFPGQGSKLMDCLKYVAFKYLHLHSLKLEVLESNKHAYLFYKKKGFAKEGKLKDFVFKDGKWVDVAVMGIIYGIKDC